MSSHVLVVIPAFRAARFIGDAVRSVLGQTHERWNLRVVDDGSDDETAAAAREAAHDDPRISVVSRTNGGVAAARNDGFAAAIGEAEWVAFLDADDVWEPEALSSLLGGVRPGYAASYGLARLIDAAGRPLPDAEFLARQRRRRAFDGRGIRALAPTEPSDFGAMITACPAATPGAVLIRAAAFRACGGFRTEAQPTEDWDCWVRLSRIGPFGFVDRTVLRHRRHAANVSGDSASMRRGRAALGRAWASDPQFTAEERRWAAAAGPANQRYMAAAAAARAARSLREGAWGGALRDFGRAADHLRRSWRG
jgi:glycosyltransferase involved in cell wall biosynthesis